MPLVTPRGPQWKRLFDAARECARYGNHRLAERYLTEMESSLVLTKERREDGKAREILERVVLEPTAFVAARDKLSAVVRLGVDTLVQSAWQRQGRLVLSGRERLARFDAYRALVAQVHNGGGSLVRDHEGLALSVRVAPANAGDVEVLRVYMPAVERDRYMASVLDKIASGEWPLKRIGLRFKRKNARGDKVKAQLTYLRPARVVEPGTLSAVIALEDNGQRLVVRCDGRERHFTDRLHRLSSMKEHFAEIHSRVRMGLGKARRWHDARRALARAGGFEQWAESPLHELSARIVDWARSQDAGELQWAIEGDGGLPWARVRELCRYKGAEMGLLLVERSGDADGEAAETQEKSGVDGVGERGARKRAKKASDGKGMRGKPRSEK